MHPLYQRRSSPTNNVIMIMIMVMAMAINIMVMVMVMVKVDTHNATGTKVGPCN